MTIFWLSSNSSADAPLRSVSDVLREQARGGEFACKRCRNYKGELKCSYGIFIGWVGCDTSRCVYFKEERRKKES